MRRDSDARSSSARESLRLPLTGSELTLPSGWPARTYEYFLMASAALLVTTSAAADGVALIHPGSDCQQIWETLG